MRNLADELRTQKEKLYGALTLFTGAVLWLVIVWAVWAGLTSADPNAAALTRTYVGYAIAAAIMVMISRAYYRATRRSRCRRRWHCPRSSWGSS